LDDGRIGAEFKLILPARSASPITGAV